MSMAVNVQNRFDLNVLPDGLPPRLNYPDGTLIGDLPITFVRSRKGGFNNFWTRIITLQECYTMIRGEDNHFNRKWTQFKTGKLEKRSLPYIIPGSLLSTQNRFITGNNVVHVTGIVPLDIDQRTLSASDIDAIKSDFRLSASQYHIPLLIYTSPSGEGLKALIYTRVNLNCINHQLYSSRIKALLKSIAKHTGWPIDTSQGDRVRRSFLAYDPEAWLNSLNQKQNENYTS